LRRAGRVRHTIATLPRLSTGAERHTEIHDQRVFVADRVRRWLRTAGFEVRRLPGYPGLRAQPGRVVFLAVRRSPRAEGERSPSGPSARGAARSVTARGPRARRRRCEGEPAGPEPPRPGQP
jgi:hypothetical protein